MSNACANGRAERYLPMVNMHHVPGSVNKIGTICGQNRSQQTYGEIPTQPQAPRYVLTVFSVSHTLTASSRAAAPPADPAS